MRIMTTVSWDASVRRSMSKRAEYGVRTFCNVPILNNVNQTLAFSGSTVLYLAQAVLCGELAVPCTYNPLQ